MDHHERISINTPPHRQAGRCFELGLMSASYSQKEPHCVRDLNPESRSYEPGALPLSYPTLPVHLSDLAFSMLTGMGRHVVKNEGILGLYNGISASVGRQMTYSLARFAVYEYIKVSLLVSQSPTQSVSISPGSFYHQ